MNATYSDLRSNAEKIVDESIKEQVQNGIAFLEENFGPDWVEFVDPRSLSLDSCSMCVLGQVFDPKKHPENVKRIRGDVHDPWGDGYDIASEAFCAEDGDWDPVTLGFSSDGDFDELTKGWRTAFWGVVPGE